MSGTLESEMSESLHSGFSSGMTRRALMTRLVVASGALAVLPSVSSALAPAGAVERIAVRQGATGRGPVVGFHMDQPYLDYSGTAEPYRPARGLRSAEPLAALSEAELRCRIGYL